MGVIVINQFDLLGTGRSATLSNDELYRYELRHVWEPNMPFLGWIGLNPSTADAFVDDPTVRRIVGFSKHWGYGGFVLVNLFAYRATKPTDMRTAPDPVGPYNDMHITQMFHLCDRVVACWGANGNYLNRNSDVMGMLKEIWCLDTTKDGHPRHPLYLPKTTILRRINP